jgi:uncharacterized protein (TIGR03437 family)
MVRIRHLGLLFLLLSALHAQTQSGWSSWGLLPFRGYDFVIVQAPNRYILYYTKHPTDTIGEQEGLIGKSDVGRAFSPDLKTWTVDTGDVCATSGDLCRLGIPRAGVLRLPDGRNRMYIRIGGGLTSYISTDGVVWTLENGIRLADDPTSIYEQGSFSMQLVSLVYLPDGSVRMYFEGGVKKDAKPWYNSIFYNGAILSAISKDNGLTFVREPGVRVNPLVQGPVNLVGVQNQVQNQYAGADVTAVATVENGRAVYRIFAPGVDGAVSYISDDGLSFALEGAVPAVAGDPKAITMPDGRIWLVTNQFPDAVVDMLVYGPQTLFLDSVKADVGRLPGSGFAAPFQSALLGVTGTAAGPVTFEAVAGSTTCDTLCAFRPDYYSFSPASLTPPGTLRVTYTGPPEYSTLDLILHAKASGVTAVGAIRCTKQVLGRSDASVFCKKENADLPMNKLALGFSAGAQAASQVSNLLSLGGAGYPFTAASSAPWLKVSPASGAAPQPITVTADPGGLAAGTYTGTVTVSAEGTTQKITVTAVVAAGPVITSIANAASGTAAISPNSYISIYGSGFAAAPVVWSPVTSLPTSLGGVSVKINGKDAYVYFASASQINVLTPPDTTAGTVAVEVTTGAGTAKSTATLTAVTPSWFAYTAGTATTLAALFGNTATYVAPVGILPGITSHSAKSGDILQLYANGLGATLPAAPPGVVLTTAYPLDDLSRVKVLIEGKAATVLFAGLVSSGLYQVNVQVPAGIGTGDLQVQMYVDGQAAQGGVTLNFQ